jgi:hypothetical protein
MYNNVLFAVTGNLTASASIATCHAVCIIVDVCETIVAREV